MQIMLTHATKDVQCQVMQSCLGLHICKCVSRTTQHSVILPTNKAEYVAMVHGTKTALAIRATLDFT